ncbi:MAG: hypothetical protein HYU36_16845 [Planctomycetes bacterium]|nr:hypothetical protein [Planctomycetota bacterium]
MARTIRIRLPAGEHPIVVRAAEIFRREVRARCGVEAATDAPGEMTLTLGVRPETGSGGFRIEDGPDAGVRVLGSDEPGVLYGIGKFLRTSRYGCGEFIAGSWRGVSVPERDVRGIYFASHFHNYYHEAPVQEVVRYIEELALWGINHLGVWFDMHHFQGFHDPQAQRFLSRLRAYLSAGRNVGMRVGLGVLANEGYADSPASLRIPRTHGAYGVELCPSEPVGRDLVCRWVEELLRSLTDIGLGLFWVWPYDQGGCACPRCWPWGAKGFIDAAQPLARIARRVFPGIRVILSTWYFDYYILRNAKEGLPYRPGEEWDGLLDRFPVRPDWLDYILVDEEEGRSWPRRLSRDGRVPGHLPLITFPEISMRGMHPWGGFGANPQPRHLPLRRNTPAVRLAGGIPYSEGIFEDMNKAILAQFHWRDQQDSDETVREYASYEFGPAVADRVVEAARILEQTMIRSEKAEGGVTRFVLQHPAGAFEAHAILQQVESELPAWARQSWRWRILYLRSLIDRELVSNDFIPNDPCEEAFQELNRLYHAEKGIYSVSPPTRAVLERRRR